jgi:hypothetical protein
MAPTEPETAIRMLEAVRLGIEALKAMELPPDARRVV